MSHPKYFLFACFLKSGNLNSVCFYDSSNSIPVQTATLLKQEGSPFSPWRPPGAISCLLLLPLKIGASLALGQTLRCFLRQLKRAEVRPEIKGAVM